MRLLFKVNEIEFRLDVRSAPRLICTQSLGDNVNWQQSKCTVWNTDSHSSHKAIIFYYKSSLSKNARILKLADETNEAKTKAIPSILSLRF